jgi:predicted alpha/beta-fold hydrolase
MNSKIQTGLSFISAHGSVSFDLMGKDTQFLMKNLQNECQFAEKDVFAGVVCMNLRGFSGEPNRKLRFYRHKNIEDLDKVIRHTLNGG